MFISSIDPVFLPAHPRTNEIPARQSICVFLGRDWVTAMFAMKIFIIPSLVTMVLAVNCCEQTKLPEVHAIGGKATHPYEAIAKGQGWLSSLRRGDDIVRKLAAMNSDELSKVDISAYRGEQAAFVGGCAPPGGTNDLLIESAYYLRVVTPSGKDLRPHSAWWEVMVCGTILQVLPKNRIIVIEVEEEGWTTIQTG